MGLDSIGNWRSLGLVTPSLNDWISYDFQTSTVQSIYRISFSGIIPDRPKSYVIIRLRFFVDGIDTTTRSLRVYPSQDKKIVELLIPDYFIGATNFRVIPEVKKITPYKGRRGAIIDDEKYIVRIEELIRSRVTTPIENDIEVGQPVFNGIEILPD